MTLSKNDKETMMITYKKVLLKTGIRKQTCKQELF